MICRLLLCHRAPAQRRHAHPPGRRPQRPCRLRLPFPSQPARRSPRPAFVGWDRSSPRAKCEIPLSSSGEFPRDPRCLSPHCSRDKTRRACQYTVWSTSIVRPRPGIDLGSGTTRSGRDLRRSSPLGKRSDAAPSGVGQGGGTSERIRTKVRRETGYRSRFVTRDEGESESGIPSSSPASSVPRSSRSEG